MSRERELLQRMLKLIDEVDVSCYPFGRDLERDIRAELQKPEPVKCGVLLIGPEYQSGYFIDCYNNHFPGGKYRLLAERIDD